MFFASCTSECSICSRKKNIFSPLSYLFLSKPKLMVSSLQSLTPVLWNPYVLLKFSTIILLISLVSFVYIIVKSINSEIILLLNFWSNAAKSLFYSSSHYSSIHFHSKLTFQHCFVWNALQHVSVVNVHSPYLLYSRKKMWYACQEEKMAKSEKKTGGAHSPWIDKAYLESIY